MLFILVPLFAAAQTPIDNLQRCLRLFDRIASHAGEQIARDGETVAFVRPPSHDQPEWRFFFSRLVTVLNDSLAIPVFVEPNDSSAILELTYQLHRCELVYRPLPRKFFLRHGKLERVASVLVELGARDLRSGQIRFQKIWQETATDTLEQRFLSRLEDPKLPFTVGRWEKEGGGFSWLEPALITAVTGTIIYLFYSLRSR